MFEDMQKYFEQINDKHQIMWEEFLRQVGGSPPPNVKVGDRVIVNAGLLNRGHLWIRIVCTVVEVAEHSCLVKHSGEHEFDNWEEWIDLYVITDVLPPKE